MTQPTAMSGPQIPNAIHAAQGPSAEPLGKSVVAVERERRIEDTARLDWLQQKFARANQAAILSKMSDGRPDYKCCSGFHCGDTIREAIDAAMQSSALASLPDEKEEGGE